MAGATVAQVVQEKGAQGFWEFYGFMFDHNPETKKYFKGHENLSGAEVLKNDFFKKQGAVLHKTIHELAEKYDNKSAFNSYTDDIIDRHVRRNIMLDPKLWKEFWQIFINFLESKGTVDEGTKKAILQFGNDFSTECLNRLKATGH